MMTERTKFLAPVLAMIFSFFINFLNAQTIQPYYFGINAWMPDTIGNVNACPDPPCYLNGKLHANWQKIKESKTQLVRFGGIAADKNMPTNSQYIKMIDSIRANGMEPVVQVPYYNGRYSSQQAAAIVQYVNKTKARNVKYWIIGNEPDLKYAATSASQVASYIKPFATAMKAVDSTIKIVGPETAWFNKSIIDGLTNPGGPYDVTGKDANGRYYIDVISFHIYPMGDNTSSVPTRSAVIAKLTGTNSFESNAAYLVSRLATANSYHSRSGDKVLKAAVTEANVAFANNANDNIYGVGANSFLGAQFVAEVYGIGLRQGLAWVNLWSVVEGSNVQSSLGFLDKSTGNRKPLFHHFKMMAENFKGSSISATDNQTNIKAFASKNGQKTVVMIMNQELSTDHNFTLRLNTSAVSGTNSLKINVNSGINREYTDNIANQSTILLHFDGAGNLTEKAVYSLSVHAASNAAPTRTLYPVIDLVLNSAGSSPTVVAGSVLTASATIHNAGSTPANASKVGFYLSADTTLNSGDLLIGAGVGSTLSGSASAVRQASAVIAASIAPGSYYLISVADHLNEVSEVNEANNQKKSLITIAPTPSVVQTNSVDLTIKNAVLTPTSVLAGGIVTINCTIFNQGSLTATNGKVGYYISSDTILDATDGFMAYSSASTLSPNTGAARTKTLNIYSTMPAGKYYIIQKADYDNLVTESNELNNISRSALQITSPLAGNVDLRITSVSSLTGIQAGSTFTAGASVLNSGTTAASSSKVGFYLSTDTIVGNDLLIATASGGTLGANASASRTIASTLPATLTPGTHYLLAYADPSSEVSETNELNNIRSSAFNIAQVLSGDLMMAGVAVSNTAITAPSTVQLTYTLSNAGLASAKATKTGFYLSLNSTLDANDQLLASVNQTSLAGGASATGAVTATLGSGTVAQQYYLIFAADHASEYAEGNEMNNTSSVLINVSGGAAAPDLMLSSASINSSTLVAGSKLTLSAYISNAGTASSASSKVGYYLSADTVFQSTDQYLGGSSGGQLGASAGSSRGLTVKLPVNQQAGSYFVLFVADHLMEVAESNENNNVKHSALQVVPRKMDFAITTVQSAENVSSVVAGNQVLYNAGLANNGNTEMSTAVSYFLSSDAVLDKNDLLLLESESGQLAQGSSTMLGAMCRIPSGVAPGNYFIIADADHSQSLNEENELNNHAAIAVKVEGLGTDIKESGNKGFSLYPNPSAGDITIELPSVNSDARGKIQIIDAAGRVQFEREVDFYENRAGIQLPSGIAGGVYIARITIGDQSFSKSLMIRK